MRDDVSPEEFNALMAHFALLPDRLGLAVSGGPDSMALALLTKRWCEKGGFPPPLAFVVDHGLRAESADEARQVKQRLAALGIKAEILRWEHGPIASRLHSEARKHRYRLLLDACRRHGLSCLLFAHQREDQAETILMRFAKGTGIDGLAGIPAEIRMEGIRIVRPLLSLPKERLIAACRDAEVAYVTDPSNDLEKFARGRLRRVLPLLAGEGMSVERLLDFGARATEASEALDFYAAVFLKTAGEYDEFGAYRIEKKPLLDLPRAVALRALAVALRTVHAGDYAPRHAALSLLLEALAAESFTPRTLNGCLISAGGMYIAIIREYAAITEIVPIRAGEGVLWDSRWCVTLSAGVGIYHIGAMGPLTHEMLDRLAPGLRKKAPQGRLRATLPALWREGKIALLPFFHPEGEAEASLIRTL